MQLCKDIELKSQNKAAEQPRSKPNRIEPKPNQSNYRAYNYDRERAVGYNLPDSHMIVYKIENEEHVLCLPVNF